MSKLTEAELSREVPMAWIAGNDPRWAVLSEKWKRRHPEAGSPFPMWSKNVASSKGMGWFFRESDLVAL